MTIAELVHGAYRAKTQTQQQQRLEFIGATSAMCQYIGDAVRPTGGASKGNNKRWVSVCFEDLLIGATALHLGYNVATLNLRDFKRIPGLSVIQL